MLLFRALRSFQSVCERNIHVLYVCNVLHCKVHWYELFTVVFGKFFFFLSFILMLGYFILFLKFSLHSLVYVTVLNSWIQMFMHSWINGSHGKVVESHDLTTYLPSLCHILTVIFIRKTKSHAIGYNINYN